MDVILTPPVYIPAVPEKVPSDKVPACILPVMVTALSRLTTTDPTFPVTATVEVFILEPPSIKNVSVAKFKGSAAFKSPLYVSVEAAAAPSA